MINRRNLLRFFAGSTAALSLTPSPLVSATVPEDEAWLRYIVDRKHRAFLDIRSFMLDGYAFKKVGSLRTALMSSFGASADDVGIAFGAGSNGLAHVLGPDLWEEYHVGARLTRSHPDLAAELKAERAVGQQMSASVQELRGMGVRVLACRNTIAKWSRDFAAVSGETPDAVNAKMLKGLSEGVEPVPAMVAAAVLAQARQLSYVAIG